LILAKNGWNLFYANDQFEIEGFGISEDGFITVLSDKNNYIIKLFDENNLFVKKKEIEKSSRLYLGVPRLFGVGEKFVFGPTEKKYYNFDLESKKIKKNRYPFKSWGTPFYLPDAYYLSRSFNLGSVSIYNENLQKQSHFLVDYFKKASDTLYKANFKTDILKINPSIPFIQFEVINKESYDYILLDNINGKLLAFSGQEIVDCIILEKLGLEASSIFGTSFSCELIKDSFTDQLYMRYDKNLYVIDTNILEIKIIDSSQYYSSFIEIYKNKVYAIFQIEELNTSGIYYKTID
jgi:hypothetical protein